jgi:hypothetical protein
MTEGKAERMEEYKRKMISRKKEMQKKGKCLNKEKKSKSRNERRQIIYSPLFYM